MKSHGQTTCLIAISFLGECNGRGFETHVVVQLYKHLQAISPNSNKKKKA